LQSRFSEGGDTLRHILARYGHRNIIIFGKIDPRVSIIAEKILFAVRIDSLLGNRESGARVLIIVAATAASLLVVAVVR